ncbi:hypothetical protein RND71_009786 [Anisodus tanguticus]|uniref:Uncharacterized protein n=1 Tax=Anisodus tanguticus TaxID=243964 RepID=A0AAE1SKC6_9SOLA|nr:hypothetical protein RND71_009786 [Anisodus tanguticus]
MSVAFLKRILLTFFNQNPADITHTDDEKYMRTVEDQRIRDKSALREKLEGVHLDGRKWQMIMWVRSPPSLVDGACGGVNLVALIRWTQADTDHVCTSRDLPGGGVLKDRQNKLRLLHSITMCFHELNFVAFRRTKKMGIGSGQVQGGSRS